MGDGEIKYVVPILAFAHRAPCIQGKAEVEPSSWKPVQDSDTTTRRLRENSHTLVLLKLVPRQTSAGVML